MNITKVSVTWGETQSLPEYCNVKPSVTLEAQLAPEENLDLCILSLQRRAQEYVHELVDEALENEGRSAKHSPEPRFKVYESPRRRCLVIVPQALSVNALGEDFTSIFMIPNNLRMEHLLKMIADRKMANRAVIDCSDGDLTRIPPLPEKQAELESEPEEEWEDFKDEEDEDGNNE